MAFPSKSVDKCFPRMSVSLYHAGRCILGTLRSPHPSGGSLDHSMLLDGSNSADVRITCRRAALSLSVNVVH
jgi:hypothetical protein